MNYGFMNTLCLIAKPQFKAPLIKLPKAPNLICWKVALGVEHLAFKSESQGVILYDLRFFIHIAWLLYMRGRSQERRRRVCAGWCCVWEVVVGCSRGVLGSGEHKWIQICPRTGTSPHSW